MRKLNKTTLFLGITFAVCYSMVGIFYLIAGKPGIISGTVLAVIYMFFPMISVLIVEKLIHKQAIKKSLGISFKFNKWFLVAWLIMPLISFLTFGISLLLPEVSYSPEMHGMVKKFSGILTPEQMEQMKTSMATLPIHPVWLALIQGFIAGVTVNAIAGFGEELGWRGFLLREFKGMTFWKASFLIGVIWGVWHAPLILLGHNYPQHPVAGVFMMTLWCLLLAPVFNYIRIKSGSVIAASIMHGTLNATAGIAIMVIDGGNDLTVGITGFSGMAALCITIFILYVVDAKILKENIMKEKIEDHLEKET